MAGPTYERFKVLPQMPRQLRELDREFHNSKRSCMNRTGSNRIEPDREFHNQKLRPNISEFFCPQISIMKLAIQLAERSEPSRAEPSR
jgi:hypothetical protein